jgi:hypothetical protein
MVELINLQHQCLEFLQLNSDHCQGCPINYYCTSVGCKEGDCSSCLHQIQFGQPLFSYSCTKITYLYVLRFFNRFASEICNAICRYKFKNPERVNVVSLGCGPGSEIYGIIKAFRILNLNAKLYYEGHDLLNVWEPVQALCKKSLAQTQHDIDFHNTNLFADFHGFDNNEINILILNYLLSHAAKFYSDRGKRLFVNDIYDFIIQNNVRNILFNDINYYGYYNKLDSGVQLVKLLISLFDNNNVNYKVLYLCFPYDPYRGNEGWFFYSNNDLKFMNHNNNAYMKNVDYCNSKQILIHLL